MKSTGESLRTAREIRKMSLKEVAKATKIRECFLRAIEEDRYDLLPPGFYAKGFLTVYARCLGLDPNDIILRYQSYLENLTISQSLEKQQQVPPAEKRIRPLRLLFLILAIIIFVALFLFLTSDLPSGWFHPFFSSTQTPLPIHEQKETQAIYHAERKELLTSKDSRAQGTIVPKTLPLEILEARTGTGIENKEGVLTITGKSSEFICNNQKIYFFTRIKTRREGKITHVWLWEGKEFYRREIEIKPPACSVYSYLTLRPQHAGNWKAEVRDGDNVLNSLPFKAVVVGSYSIKEREAY